MESRTKNATRNIFYGLIVRIFNIFIPFVLRTVMIYLMGVEYLGLNGLFVSVLQVLNMAELGAGSAMIYSMYKPVAENDNVTLCALMKLYRTYYRIIGGVIAVLGLALTPFIHRLINGEVPDNISIYILYILNLSATVASYWLFAYKNSILQACQRTDVISKVDLITSIMKYGLQILVLWLFRNYYLYVMVALATQITTNLITAFWADKLYPEIIPKGEVEKEKVKEINKRIRDIFTAKFGGIITNSADSIVISTFLGLATLGIYQNYLFILNSVYGLVMVFFSSIKAGIGNSLVTESAEKNYDDLKKMTFISAWIITICCNCFVALYQPFMKIWVGEKLMLDNSFVSLFCIYFFVLTISMVWATVKDAAGLWSQDRFRPLIGSLVNLALNLLLVNYIGLYGVVLSTVISYVLILIPWLIHNIFHYLYKVNAMPYIKKLGLYALVCLISCALTNGLCMIIHLDGIVAVLVYGVLAVSVSLLLQLCLYFRTKEFQALKKIFIRMIRKKI